MTRDEWRNVFGDNLADVLFEQKYSQKQFAKDSGLSTSMVSDYINKWTVPSIPAIISMAYTLDIDINEFVDFGDRIDG